MCMHDRPLYFARVLSSFKQSVVALRAITISSVFSKTIKNDNNLLPTDPSSVISMYGAELITN